MQKETDFTVGRWCNRWFCENRGRWSGSTVGGYRNLIYRHILPGIGGIPLVELSECTVTSFYDSLRSQGLSARRSGAFICSCGAVWMKRPAISAFHTTRCDSARSHKQKSMKQLPYAWGSSSGI